MKLAGRIRVGGPGNRNPASGMDGVDAGTRHQQTLGVPSTLVGPPTRRLGSGGVAAATDSISGRRRTCVNPSTRRITNLKVIVDGRPAKNNRQVPPPWTTGGAIVCKHI